MMANLMTFYGFSKEEILWKMSMTEFALWIRQMLAIKDGKMIEEEITAEEIKSQFEWDEKEKRYK